MKKFSALSLALIMMITNVFAADVTVFLNNEEVSFTSQQPVIIDGRTLIPLRSIFENLGYTIDWLADTKTAVLKSENATATFTANCETFDLNGKSVLLDTPAQIINGSMMLPLRAIGEASGLSVGWDNETKVVNIETKAQESEKEGVTVKAEIQEFYDNLKSYKKINNYLMYISFTSMSRDFDIMTGIYEKTLAYTKASEMIDKLNAYYDEVYKQLDTFKASDDYKTAKRTLLDIINDFKKAAEYNKNYYNNVYSNDEAYEEDLENLFEQTHIRNASLESELAKLYNDYLLIMYKYFDTDKDTEENRAIIAEFADKLSKIDAEFPMPDYDDIYDEEGNYIIDNFDKIIETIENAAEGRLTAYQNTNAPERCKERLELLICSNEVLENMAAAFENYKDYGSNELNPYEAEIEYNISLYDNISTLAADGKLKRINIEDEEKFDFETHIDDNYNTIRIEGVSDETQDFLNRLYYLGAINWYINKNDELNNYYDFLMNYDESTTISTKNTKKFFTEWKDTQNKLLNNLKSLIVNEDLMAVKSAAVNYIDLDINYTSELEKIYTKQYTEEQFKNISEEIFKKLAAANENYSSETTRIETLINKYLYDYCDYDNTRTENSEVEKFGKSIEEINQKYPIFDDVFAVYGSMYGSEIYILNDSEIKSISSKSENIISNIEKREAEYKNIDIPDSCKMRLELIYGADKLIIDYADLCKNLKANDEDSSFNFVFSQYNCTDIYSFLLYFATGGEADLY